MSYIYKITNNTNQSKYIGKTARKPQVRWKEHIKNSKDPAKNYLPLYKAMNKYGVNNFSFEVIEECDDSETDNREMYWISYYNTYQGRGYNCTAGGEGSFLEIPEIEEMILRYKAGERIDFLCSEYHHDYYKIKEEFSKRGVVIDTHAGPKKLSKQVQAISPISNEVVEVFPSISAAARAICPEGHNYKSIANHISRYKNTNTISHGYYWRTV